MKTLIAFLISISSQAQFQFSDFHCYQSSTESCFDFDENSTVNITDFLRVTSLFGSNDFDITTFLLFTGDFGSGQCEIETTILDSFTDYFFASSGAIFSYDESSGISLGILLYTSEDETENYYECELLCLNSFKYIVTYCDGSEEIYFFAR